MLGLADYGSGDEEACRPAPKPKKRRVVVGNRLAGSEDVLGVTLPSFSAPTQVPKIAPELEAELEQQERTEAEEQRKQEDLDLKVAGFMADIDNVVARREPEFARAGAGEVVVQAAQVLHQTKRTEAPAAGRCKGQDRRKIVGTLSHKSGIKERTKQSLEKGQSSWRCESEKGFWKTDEEFHVLRDHYDG
eukprot:Hpha_TRINITY_DN6245_c0_g1::TRINITY_DN6245_c0_g1_i1::g.23705::m.23705